MRSAGDQAGAADIVPKLYLEHVQAPGTLMETYVILGVAMRGVSLAEPTMDWDETRFGNLLFGLAAT